MFIPFSLLKLDLFLVAFFSSTGPVYFKVREAPLNWNIVDMYIHVKSIFNYTCSIYPCQYLALVIDLSAMVCSSGWGGIMLITG